MRTYTSSIFKQFILFFSILLFPTILFAQEQEYRRIYLSGEDAKETVDWEFKVTDGRRAGEWNTIPVPSNWELEGFGTYNYGRDWNKDIKMGAEHGFYKHRFEVPQGWKGKTINIVFDGSMTDTRVSINGKSAGEMHQGSFYRFQYEISDLLKYGEENLLEVEVSKISENESVNLAERHADFWTFGGIFRPVFLEVLPATHFSNVSIAAGYQGDFQASIKLSDSVEDGMIRIAISSSEGKQVGALLEQSFSAGNKEVLVSEKLEGITSWNPESPALYTATIQLLQDGTIVYEKDEQFGFRTVELREKDGLYVNDTKVVLKGVNRHSFWPETGRALSDQNHLQDVRLMKEMNMNAVRMSHYPPDERFLEICDSLGLFVIDELTGWQDAYDSIVGPKLIKELILKDENHPSIIMWAHGNEGGWDLSSEKWFHHYDLQNRPVIYPWALRNGIDTRHYPDYNYGINRLAKGDDVFMPTEFLHGMFDEGLGSGLDDYWQSYMENPAFAGGFLWVLSDEAVVRTDQDGRLDSNGQNAPDGIVGPHREKEASFYTIKEIWSPVQIQPVIIRPGFNGKLIVKNEYLFTNLNQCSFSYTISSVNGFSELKTINSGEIKAPDVEPNLTGILQFEVPDDFSDADIFSLTATNPEGMEIYTWSWPVKKHKEITDDLISALQAESPANAEINLTENGDQVRVKAGDLTFEFRKNNGFLQQVTNAGEIIPLSGGPLLVGLEQKKGAVDWEKDEEGNFVLEIHNETYPEKIQWKVLKSGLLRLEVSPLHLKKDSIDYLGISFNYPEKKVKGVTWMGQGPYRVWKNRKKGAELGVWQKDYNNTITGESFEELVYPEFKGYHGEFYWAELETTGKPFRILTETPGLYLRLFTPLKPENDFDDIAPPFPEGDLSFLYEIPPIGTRFRKAEKLGPSSQKGQTNFHEGDQNPPLIVWFDFANGKK